MTIAPPTVAPPTVTPIDLSGYPSSHRSFTGVSSFTYDSAMTYTELVDSIRRWIPQVLIPWIGDNFGGFEQSWVDESDALQEYITDALTAQNNTVNAAIAQATQDWATANVDITDPAMKAAVSTIGSATRTYLDSLYGAGAMADAPLKTVLADPTTHTSRDYLDDRYGYQLGQYRAPAPTGVAATDTANLTAAITAAYNANADLLLTPSPLGAIRAYVVTSKLSWDVSRGSIRARGHIAIDFSQMPANTTGAAFTVTGPNAVGGYNHTGSMHRLEGFQIIGHGTDTSTMDGFLFQDAGMGLDQGLIESVMVNGFRDNITFGSNAWSLTYNKVFSTNAHRYGVNLTVGTVAGECITFTNCTISGSHNATNSAVAIYSPPAGGAGFRMISGSLDYNDNEGRIEGGALTFHAVHIEDNKLGAMFTYTQSQAIVNVSFRDCTWDSSAGAVRPYIHQVLPGSGTKITVTFDGDKGGVYPNTWSTWFTDASNNINGDLGISSYVRGSHLDGVYFLGQFYNMLSNGDFGTSSTFVATPGVGGWAIPATGTWSIGAGGQPGSALKLVASTAVTGNTVQRIPLPADRRPFRLGGKMLVTALTAGGVQLAIQFLAADGTTPILGGIRIDASVNTADATNWQYRVRRFTPPPGAAYVSIQCGATGFIGTAYWDEIEVVPV